MTQEPAYVRAFCIPEYYNNMPKEEYFVGCACFYTQTHTQAQSSHKLLCGTSSLEAPTPSVSEVSGKKLTYFRRTNSPCQTINVTCLTHLPQWQILIKVNVGNSLLFMTNSFGLGTIFLPRWVTRTTFTEKQTQNALFRASQHCVLFLVLMNEYTTFGTNQFYIFKIYANTQINKYTHNLLYIRHCTTAQNIH